MTDTTETPEAENRNRLHRFADWLDNWHVTRIFNALSAFAILLAVAAFAIDMVGRTEERIARAWQLVTTKAPGNSGKVQALEYLHSEDWWWPFKKRVPLVGIDLSEDAGVYLAFVRLPRAHLKGAQLLRAYLRGADLQGATLELADLRRTNLTVANLRDAKLRGANLSGANLGHATLTAATLNSADLSGASLSFANLQGAHLFDATLVDANVNEADFAGAVGLTQEQLDQAWTWRGLEPKNLPAGLTMNRTCEITTGGFFDHGRGSIEAEESIDPEHPLPPPPC